MLVDLLLDQRAAIGAPLALLLLGGRALLLELANLVLESGGTLPVGALRRLLQLQSLLVQLLLNSTDRIQLVQLGLPLRLQRRRLLLQPG